MSENKRYGNLLDNYNRTYDKRIQEAKKAEQWKKYGNLISKVKPDQTIENNMARMNCVIAATNQREEEREAWFQQMVQERTERKQRELEEHRNRNDAIIGSYLEQKRVEEQERKAKRAEEERMHKELKKVEELVKISPKLAEVYAGQWFGRSNFDGAYQVKVSGMPYFFHKGMHVISEYQIFNAY